MKFFKRLNLYKSGKGAGTNVYDPSKEEAHSYGWYCYAKKFNKVGWVINACSYSTTTGKHINKFLRVVGYPKTKYIYAPKGLKDKSSIIFHYEQEIKKLLGAINTPKTRKDKNIERASLVRRHRETIKFVQKYL